MRPNPWPPPPGFRVISIASSFETPRSTFGPIVLDHFSLTWIVEGGGQSTLDDRRIDTRPGSVILMRPGIVLRHDWGAVTSFQTFVVFEFETLPPGWPDASTWQVEWQLSPDDFIFGLWRFLVAVERADTDHGAVVSSGAELLIRMLLTGHTAEIATTSSGISDPVQRAVTFVSERLVAKPEAPPRLADIARQAHVTAPHLCRLFRRDLGVGPMECVSLLRVEQAAGLLERTELSIGEVAERFGYSSQFHFSRVFKKSYGVAPSAYRNAFRAGLATRPGGLMYRNHRLRHYLLYERAPGQIRLHSAPMQQSPPAPEPRRRSSRP